MRVSVLVPNYNGGKYILTAIKSLLTQTYTDIQIVIVDDCSTDNSVSLVENIKDSRILLIKLKENKGMANALNVAIENALGDILVRMDSDDISQKDRIRKIVREFDIDSKLVAVSSWMNVFGKTNEVWRYPQNDKYLKVNMLFGSPLSHPASAFRAKTLVENDIVYTNDYANHYPLEDYHLFYRLSKFGKFKVIQECLYDYRIHDSNLTVSHKKGRKKGVLELSNYIIYNTLGIMPNSMELENHYALSSCNLKDLEYNSFFKWIKRLSSAVKDSNDLDYDAFAEVLHNQLIKLLFNSYAENQLFALKLCFRYNLFSITFAKYAIASTLKKK